MSMYRLKGTSGPVINQSLTLDEVTLIGSDASCDIVLEAPGVAGRHAEIRLLPDGLVRAVNLDPAHETLCNGEPVAERIVTPGDELRIGACRWLLQAPGMRPDRVLTDEALKPSQPIWPWLLPVVLLLAALLAWQRGWLPF